MARNERQEDEARDVRGSVSTITRPGVRQRPAAAPRRVPAQAGGLPGKAQAAPSAPPKPNALKPSAAPKPSVHPAPGARPAPHPAAGPATARGTHRAPFVLLLCGLLGGALVSALVISTTLAAGAFQITNLQNSTTTQAKQLQSLQEEVAQAQSAQQIATRAAKLGMVGVGQLRVVDLKTGKITTDADPGFVGKIPGYTP